MCILLILGAGYGTAWAFCLALTFAATGVT